MRTFVKLKQFQKKKSYHHTEAYRLLYSMINPQNNQDFLVSLGRTALESCGQVSGTGNK